ncbi:MAG TPA: carboxypeptidase regulatory-like domain-containing protein [Bacteroidota bacterium]|nr:carboxypeptidase regulatory-like domain-containing protein [Bacteroidota bacterium]
MNSKTYVVLLIGVLLLGAWNCKDLPPSTSNNNPLSKKVSVSGTVSDLATSLPISNATVLRNAGGLIDSTHTDANGNYSFEYDQGGDSVQTTITVIARGYVTSVNTFVMAANTQVSVAFHMTQDLSTSALINGTVRDSMTLYPLRGSTVIYSVPGFSDQVQTSIDGYFTFVIDLVDRDSLPVAITVSKTGFRTRQIVQTVHKGQSSNLGNVLLQVDLGSTVGQILGRVFDASTKGPLLNASVLLTSSLVTDSVLSASDGSYVFSVDLKGLPNLSASLKYSKNGYKTQSVALSFVAGGATYQDIYLTRDTTTGVVRDSGTGTAHSIALIGVSTNQIAVYGVGGTESSVITWEVRDSLGYPIDIDHQDTVHFSIVGTPVLGGAYVSPSASLTNAAGRVATIINSGTVSGVLQLFATLTRKTDNVVVQSTPVLITVNAGLPDQAHFSVAPHIHNFPAYDYLDMTDQITVQVGDRYSNPVKQSTAVYFNTTGGIIDASGFTDVSGHASVNLYSGNPLPSDPILGPGFAHIVAATLGQNGVNVTDTTLILFTTHSLFPIVDADSFHVPSGGNSGRINYHITDRFGHPLAAGTHITVALQYVAPPNSQVNLTVVGNTDVLLDDTMVSGPGSTDFWFEVVDQTLGGVGAELIPASVVITIDSPNNGGGGKPSSAVPGTIGG